MLYLVHTKINKSVVEVWKSYFMHRLMELSNIELSVLVVFVSFIYLN